MKLRTINLELFLVNVILYRLSAMIVELIVFWITLNSFAIAIKTALGLNIVAFIWYIIYHYILLRTHKFGVSNE